MIPPKVILSPIDFSDHSQDALAAATELAAKFGSEILLVHAVPAIPRLTSAREFFHEGEYETELHKDAESRLGKLAEDLAQKGVKARWEVGIANDVGMEILRIAEHEGADMIVISTHGMTGWHRLAFGSVAEKVVRLASCPVLVLRADPKAAQNAHSRTRDSAAVVGKYLSWALPATLPAIASRLFRGKSQNRRPIKRTSANDRGEQTGHRKNGGDERSEQKAQRKKRRRAIEQNALRERINGLMEIK